MRKLIVCNIVSLDGYYTGPDDNVMVMPFDVGFSEYNAERLRGATTLLLGRKSFAGFRDFWPSVADDVEAAGVEREISRLNSAIDKVVVSDTLTGADISPWDNSEIVSRARAHARVAELKEEDGGDILMFDSHVLWNDLLRVGLVDELHLMTGPGVVGEGVRAFDERPRLRLLGTRTWDGSGLVLTRYATRRG